MNSLSEQYKQAALHAIRNGDVLKALDQANLGLAENPDDAELLHTSALAVFQILGSAAATRVLDAAPFDISNSPELLCLRARIEKDRWAESNDPGRIRKAVNLYRQASSLDPDNEYPAINAATCNLLAGDEPEALRLAKTAQSICQKKIDLNPDDFYSRVTLAEALAVMDDSEASRSLYAAVAASNPHRIRDLASAQRQARLISAARHGHSALYDDAFPRRRVLVMDHELIRPGEDRFAPVPDDQSIALESIIERRLRDSLCTIGFSCLTSSIEFQFIESLRKQDIRYHVVLPWSENDLSKWIIPSDQHTLFKDLLHHAESVRVLSHANSSTSEISSHYSEMVMIGVATLLARSLDLELESLVLNDTGNPLQEIDPAGDQSIKSMLFADVTSYSRLPEQAIPRFVEHFMVAVADLIETSENRVLVSNTWGDALYLVFDDPESAGNFALELQSLVSDTDWGSRGLPEDFGIRVGLHAGPVYSVVDPVIKRKSFTGFHVSWAARIEPRAAPNSIYASEEFAALAALNQHSRFKCDYVGLLPLPKNFGEKRIYRLETLDR